MSFLYPNSSVKDYLDIICLARTLVHVAVDFFSSSFVQLFLLPVLYLPVVFTNCFLSIVCHVCIHDECNMELLAASIAFGKDALMLPFGGAET